MREGLSLLLRNLLFTLVVPGSVGVYLPLWLASGRPLAGGLMGALGAAGLVLGAAIYVSCVWHFASVGRGTPAPVDAPRQLVARGLYRYSRNPMYVAVLTVVCSWALLFRAPQLVLYALAVAAAFQLFIVRYEEPHLERAFGRSYRDYRRQVARWLPGPGRLRRERESR